MINSFKNGCWHIGQGPVIKMALWHLMIEMGLIILNDYRLFPYCFRNINKEMYLSTHVLMPNIVLSYNPLAIQYGGVNLIIKVFLKVS